MKNKIVLVGILFFISNVFAKSPPLGTGACTNQYNANAR